MIEKQIKVLHFAPGFLYGGIESRLLDWYKYIDKDLIKFDLLKQINNSDKTPNIECFKNLGGEVHNIPRFTFRNFFLYIKAINLFFKTHDDYDIVHSHSLSSGLFVVYYAKKYGIKTRILHARTTKTSGGIIKKTVNNILKFIAPLYATDYFACSTQAGIWGFNKIYTRKKQVVIIKNGINVNKFKFNIDIRNKIRAELGISNSFVIGNICRLSEPKNIPFMLDVFSIIASKNHNAKLLFVGEGPLSSYIEMRIKELDIKDKVVMTGRKENVQDYYFCLDVFFAPSIWEGYSGSALEAQASGLPCVVSNELYLDELKMSDLFIPMDLKTTKDIWCDKILSLKEKRNLSENIIQIIKDKGYDVKSTSKFLEQFYLSRI